MKRAFLLAAAVGLVAAGTAFAIEHPRAQEMMKKMGQSSMTDERVELRLPETMKLMQKRMMRQHLDTVGEITGAIAAGDMLKASSIAKDKLGWSPQEEQRCNTVGAMTGEKDFVSYGMAVHKTADELSEAALSGDRERTLSLLSTLIRNCNACHERYRH